LHDERHHREGHVGRDGDIGRRARRRAAVDGDRQLRAQIAGGEDTKGGRAGRGEIDAAKPGGVECRAVVIAVVGQERIARGERPGGVGEEAVDGIVDVEIDDAGVVRGPLQERIAFATEDRAVGEVFLVRCGRGAGGHEVDRQRLRRIERVDDHCRRRRGDRAQNQRQRYQEAPRNKRFFVACSHYILTADCR
jgi:hypothetical protein